MLDSESMAWSAISICLDGGQRALLTRVPVELYQAADSLAAIKLQVETRLRSLTPTTLVTTVLRSIRPPNREVCGRAADTVDGPPPPRAHHKRDWFSTGLAVGAYLVLWRIRMITTGANSASEEETDAVPASDVGAASPGSALAHGWPLESCCPSGNWAESVGQSRRRDCNPLLSAGLPAATSKVACGYTVEPSALATVIRKILLVAWVSPPNHRANQSGMAGSELGLQLFHGARPVGRTLMRIAS